MSEPSIHVPENLKAKREPRSDDELFAFLSDELECRHQAHVDAKASVEQRAKECSAAEIAHENCKRALDALTGHQPESWAAGVESS